MGDLSAWGLAENSAADGWQNLAFRGRAALAANTRLTLQKRQLWEEACIGANPFTGSDPAPAGKTLIQVDEQHGHIYRDFAIDMAALRKVILLKEKQQHQDSVAQLKLQREREDAALQQQRKELGLSPAEIPPVDTRCCSLLVGCM